MKREIKFRVYTTVGQPKMIHMNLKELSGEDLIENDKWHVMQYTGERDFNGKCIYEGDILQGHDESDDYDHSTKLWLYKGFRTVVKFQDGAFVVDACGGDYDETAIGWAKDAGFSYEVIGNIYENPDLLPAPSERG